VPSGRCLEGKGDDEGKGEGKGKGAGGGKGKGIGGTRDRITYVSTRLNRIKIDAPVVDTKNKEVLNHERAGNGIRGRNNPQH
jgi:hypothetical protein